jgi:hypothetical protein
MDRAGLTPCLFQLGEVMTVGFKMTIGTEEAEDLVQNLEIEAAKFEDEIYDLGGIIKEAVIELIVTEVEDRADNERIGKFMASRLAIDYTYSGGVMNLHVGGALETKLPEAIRKSNNPKVNLWNQHEFGLTKDAETGLYVYNKDPDAEREKVDDGAGGIKVVRKAKVAGAPSPYKGMVTRIVNGIRPEIDALVTAIVARAATEIIDNSLRRASGNKVVFEQKDRAVVLLAAGVKPEVLTTLNASVYLNEKTGQISYRDSSGTGQFIKTDGGLPTSIKM